MRGLFIAGTGTGVGKTHVARGIAASAVSLGMRVSALKPVETGVECDPADALALATACGRTDLANADGFYRAVPPLAPIAVALGGCKASPDVGTLAGAVNRHATNADLVLVEGCGGLMVPLSENSSMLDLCVLLAFPIVLVGPNQLGVLSDVLTSVGCARQAGLTVAAVVLSDANVTSTADESALSNPEVLARCLPELGVHVFPRTPDDNVLLASACAQSGLLPALIRLGHMS